MNLAYFVPSTLWKACLEMSNAALDCTMAMRQLFRFGFLLEVRRGLRGLDRQTVG